MSRKRVVVLGGSFAGMTAAIEIKQAVGDAHDVVLWASEREFLFLPSLIWVPFGLRTRGDLVFDLAPVLEERGVAFHHIRCEKIDLAAQRLHGTDGAHVDYDFLVIATGASPDDGAVDGMGEAFGYAQSIFSWRGAERAREAFEAFSAQPGPVVVGAVPGASAFAPAYEFALNMAYQLRRAGLGEKAQLTFVTPEPHLGHLGVGGVGNGRRLLEASFDRQGILPITDAAVRAVRRDRVVLDDGRELPFGYAMLAPRFRGVDCVRACTSITDADGFVEVNDCYHNERHPEVFAVGMAVSVPPLSATRVPCSTPKPGYLSEEMARAAAYNIVAHLSGSKMVPLPHRSIDARWIIDAGNTGFIVSGERLLEQPGKAWVLPGPEAHWAKVAFEKYFLASHRRGVV